MLEALNFVKGSVAKKDFVPELQHLQIRDKRITGFNGTLSLSAPINTEFNAVPNALTFIKAINTIEGSASLTLTKSGKLKLVSGKFKAFIDCLPDWETGLTTPTGDYMLLKSPLLPLLRQLKPFISEDASRPWSRGILLRGRYAFATNNICLVQAFTGAAFPFEVVIPVAAVNELLRIKEEPEAVSFDGNAITFYFEGERWLKTSIMEPTWPDINAVLDQFAVEAGSPPPEDFFTTLNKILPFLDDSRSVFFNEGKALTSPKEEAGVSFSLDIQNKMRFNAQQLLLLEPLVKTMNLNNYPDPCSFFGDKLRGVIIGMSYEN